MLARNAPRLGLTVAAALIFFYAVYIFSTNSPGPRITLPPTGESTNGETEKASQGAVDQSADSKSSSGTNSDEHGVSLPDPSDDGPEVVHPAMDQTHQEIFSSTTADGKYLPIDFGGIAVLNPNVIPHPLMDQTWLVVAQQKNEEGIIEFKEVACDATIADGVLKCLKPPIVLPIQPTPGGHCTGEKEYFNMNVGPHDARVFLGPENAYIIFGSNSQFTCFGLFVQDFSKLIGWTTETAVHGDFSNATELQRPLPWGEVEKNWFLFWDQKGEKYVHHDVRPKRVFAQLNDDGSIGRNVGALSTLSDSKCLSKYMPFIPPTLESIHQATNSLMITMCRGHDQTCSPSDDNTFIFTIYQHKTFYNYHSVYEPYVMLFEQREPFKLYAMSKTPLWIRGREYYPERNTSDMFYVTSMSWKSRQRRYSGFLDDDLHLAFGIEDERAGVVDVSAGVVLGDLALCNEE